MARWGRVAALVMLAGLSHAVRAQDAVPTPSPAEGPQEAPVAPPPALPLPTEPAKDEEPAFKLEDLGWRKGKLSILPFGYGVFNVNYDTKSLEIGSFGLFAKPGNAVDQSQFEMSPQNTFLGLEFTGPDIADAKTGGRIDFDFRGPNPVQNNNATPYFFEIFGEIKTDLWRIVLGQAKDVVSPLDPNVLNLRHGPTGYMPGDIGFFRAEAELDLYCPLSDTAQVTWQGAFAQQVITPLQSAPDLFGTDAGWPDVQGRIALALGPLKDGSRPFEIGVSAQIGERLLEIDVVQLLRHYRVWSLNLDLRAPLWEGAKLQGEFYIGQVLGSYNGNIFQGIDPITLTPIRGGGGWLEGEQRFGSRLSAHVGVGVDEASALGLSLGGRTSSLAYWSNVYWDVTSQLTVGLEVSWWETRFIEQPEGKVFRIETAVMYRF